MKRYILILFLLVSCTKYSEEHTYTIYKGDHGSGLRFNPVIGDASVSFQFSFTENHKYLSEIPDDINKLDVNKLYGLTSTDIHLNSCRIGWRELENGNFEVLGYWYFDSKDFYFEHLYEAKIGELLYLAVSNYGNYHFSCNSEELIIPAREFNETHRAFPYFGGDNTAPHEMYFSIIEY